MIPTVKVPTLMELALDAITDTSCQFKALASGKIPSAKPTLQPKMPVLHVMMATPLTKADVLSAHKLPMPTTIPTASLLKAPSA